LIEELARNFGEARPGHRLVGIIPMALPVRVFRLRVLKMIKSPIPIGSEFIIKSISIGLSKVDEISEFLGLDKSIATQYIADELLAGTVHKTSPHDYSLTQLGKGKLLTLSRTLLEQSEIEVQIDQAAKSVVSYPGLHTDVNDVFESLQGIVEKLEDVVVLNPERAQRPTKKDFELKSLNKWFGSDETKIVEVLGLAPKKYLEKLALVWLLVYEEFGNKRKIQELVIDDSISASHRGFVNQNNFLENLRIKVEDKEEPTDLVKFANDFKFSSETLETLLSIRREIPKELIEKSPNGVPKPSEINMTPPGVGKFLLEKASPSMISVFDHKNIREEALLFAKQRLFIISPWVTLAVVNKSFARKVEFLLDRGVEVTIVHGYQDGKGDDEKSLELLSSLKKKGLSLIRHQNTHAKVMIVDNCVIFTSFNWLSFRGDPSRTYRMEEGLEFRSKVFADYLASSLLSKVQSERLK